MPSNKCLFNYFVNRALGCQLMFREKLKNQNIQFKDCPLFIMTSSQNDIDIREFFKQNKNFCVKDKNIYFLETPNKIFKAPDGNGGCLLSLKKHKIIGECLNRGIDYNNVMAIDNLLYKFPYFMDLSDELKIIFIYFTIETVYTLLLIKYIFYIQK